MHLVLRQMELLMCLVASSHSVRFASAASSFPLGGFCSQLDLFCLQWSLFWLRVCSSAQTWSPTVSTSQFIWQIVNKEAQVQHAAESKQSSKPSSKAIASKKLNCEQETSNCKQTNCTSCILAVFMISSYPICTITSYSNWKGVRTGSLAS